MKELYLTGNNGFTAKIHRKRMIIGRDWCRIFGYEYKYVTKQQFKVEKRGEDWYIYGLKAVNPTLLNGNDVTGKWERLRPDDTITVGKLVLTVRIVERLTDSYKRPPTDCKELDIKWSDHFNRTWNWRFCLNKKYVWEAQREFGTSSYGFIPFFDDTFTFSGEINYPKIAQKNLKKLKEVSISLLNLAKTVYSDKYYLLSFFLSFVQSLPYSVPPDKTESRYIYGFFTPPEVLYEGFGDCDSKGTLFLTLWKNIYEHDKLFFLIGEMVGRGPHLSTCVSNVEIPLELRLNFSMLNLDGEKCLVCEAAGPAKLLPGEMGYEFRIKTVMKF